MKKNVLIILLAFVALSCDSNDTNENTTVVTSTVIAQDNLYGDGAEGITKQNLIITNTADWNALIAKMDAVNKTSSGFSEVDVNFSEFTIIAVFDNIRSSGGYNLKLDITSNTENISVSVINLVPVGNVTSVITQPFAISKIKKSNLPIVFK